MDTIVLAGSARFKMPWLDAYDRSSGMNRLKEERDRARALHGKRNAFGRRPGSAPHFGFAAYQVGGHHIKWYGEIFEANRFVALHKAQQLAKGRLYPFLDGARIVQAAMSHK